MRQPSKILKQRARTTLLGKYFPSVCVVFLFSLISLLLTYLLDISGFSPAGDLMRQLSFWLMLAIISLLHALLSIGLTHYFFQMTLHAPFSFRDLFYGFTNNPDRFIIAIALRYGLPFLGWIPACIWYFRMPALLDSSARHILLLLLLVLFAILLNLTVLLFYGLSFYIMLEQPDCSPLESMRVSRQLMVGQKGRLFSLYMSFIGYGLLELGTMGVGKLWVRPYVEMVLIQFYLDVKGEI